MSKTRRKYSTDLKLKVVLGILKGADTISEIAHRYSAHPTQIPKWKRKFLEEAPAIYITNHIFAISVSYIPDIRGTGISYFIPRKY
jgi:hypothetical protein